MSMGNPTDLGINRYLETTTRTTFSALLNRGIDAINTYLRDIVKSGDTGWITPPLSGGWVNDFSLGYRKLNGVVYLRGRISGGSVGTAFTLPAGFRPASSNRYLVAQTAGTTPSIVSVFADGIVAPQTTSPANLNGISFPVD